VVAIDQMFDHDIQIAMLDAKFIQPTLYVRLIQNRDRPSVRVESVASYGLLHRV